MHFSMKGSEDNLAGGTEGCEESRAPEPSLPPPPAALAAVSAPAPAPAPALRSLSPPLAASPSSPRPCAEARLQDAREPPPPSTSTDGLPPPLGDAGPPPLVEPGSGAPWPPAPPRVVEAGRSLRAAAGAAPTVAPPPPPPPAAAHRPTPISLWRGPLAGRRRRPWQAPYVCAATSHEGFAGPNSVGAAGSGAQGRGRGIRRRQPGAYGREPPPSVRPLFEPGIRLVPECCAFPSGGGSV